MFDYLIASLSLLGLSAFVGYLSFKIKKDFLKGFTNTLASILAFLFVAGIVSSFIEFKIDFWGFFAFMMSIYYFVSKKGDAFKRQKSLMERLSEKHESKIKKEVDLEVYKEMFSGLSEEEIKKEIEEKNV